MNLRAKLYRLGFPLVKLAVQLFRPYLRGVRVIVMHGDDILLVRHTYGKRSHWGLPGGRIDWREEAAAAAVREVREEVGIELGSVAMVPGSPFPPTIGRGEHWVAMARTESRECTIDPGEIAEARWWHKEALPEQFLMDTKASLEAAGLL